MSGPDVSHEWSVIQGEHDGRWRYRGICTCGWFGVWRRQETRGEKGSTLENKRVSDGLAAHDALEHVQKAQGRYVEVEAS